MKKYSLIAGGAAFLFTSLLSMNATAGPSEEIIQLTHRLEDDLEHLRDDFQEHYRATWQYAGLLNLLSQVKSQNSVVHGISHNSMAGARVLENNIEKLDGQAHQLHEAVDDVERGASKDRVIGNTSAIHSHLNDITRIIHRMEDIADARVKYYGNQHGYTQQQAQQVQVVRTPFGYLQLNQGQTRQPQQHVQQPAHKPSSGFGISNQWNKTQQPRQHTQAQQQPRHYPKAQQQPRTYPQAQQPQKSSSGGSIFDRLRNKLRNR